MGVLPLAVNSGARTGSHDWSLPGGYYIDLVVETSSPISDEELGDIARLAATEEDRPIRVRRRGESWSHAMNPLLEHWQQEHTMELLYAYLHRGRSGRRFQCCAEVLRALARKKHQAEWEDLLHSETSGGRLPPAA